MSFFCGMKTIYKVIIYTVLIVTGGSPLVKAQEKKKPAKVSHAEPLYEDFVRDLGARKGEKEVNIGATFSNTGGIKQTGVLAEYEFAPVNRLGMEVEADLSFFSKSDQSGLQQIPGNRLDGLKFSTQYSFFVSEKLQSTMAIGYTQSILFADFKDFGRKQMVSGLVYRPFFIAAKRWGSSFHTLFYTYPVIEKTLGHSGADLSWEANTSFMYNPAGSKHFVGMEVNHEIIDGHYKVVLRPQVKINLDKRIAFGVVTGVPVKDKSKNVNSLFRLIYEL